MYPYTINTQVSIWFSGFFLHLEHSGIKINFSGNKEKYVAGAKDGQWLRSSFWLVWASLEKTLHGGMSVLHFVVLAKLGLHIRSQNRTAVIVVIAIAGQLSRGMAKNAQADSNQLIPGLHFHPLPTVSMNNALRILGVNQTRKDYSDLGGLRCIRHG